MKFEKKQILQLAALSLVLTSVFVGIFLFQTFRTQTNQASTSPYVTCNAPSTCTAAGSCFRQSGTVNGVCSATGDVCCTLPIPEEAAIDLTKQSASDVILGNCCNTSDYGSCVGASDAETIALFEQGYAACQTASCGSCAYTADKPVIINGLKADYYSDVNQTTLFASIKNDDIDFNWGSSAPLEGMPSENYSVVWKGTVTTQTSDDYFFEITADDSIRLWIDNKLVIDRIGDNPIEPATGEAYVQSGTYHDFKLLYIHEGGNSRVRAAALPAYSSISSITIPASLYGVEQTSQTLIDSISKGEFIGIFSGETVTGTRTISFTADPLTTSAVVFRIDSNVIFTDYEDPYTLTKSGYDFDSLAGGSHVLAAHVNSSVMGADYVVEIPFTIGYPTPTPKPTVTVTPTPVPTSSSTAKPTATPTPNPTATPTSTPIATTVQVSEDAYTDKTRPSNNYGSNSVLYSRDKHVSYLKFDFRNHIGQTISKATMYAHISSSRRADSSDLQTVYLTPGYWSESLLTSNNAPAFSGTIGTFTGQNRNEWISIDVTDFVRSHLGDYLSVAITSDGGDTLHIDSKESSNPAYIVLNEGGSTPTSTPTPTVTPTPNPTTTPSASGSPTQTSTPAPTPTPTTSPSTDKFVGINDGDTVWGTIFVGYAADPSTTRKVRFFVDNLNVTTERKYPYELNAGNGYDVTALSEGTHTLSVEVERSGGLANYGDSITFYVSNTSTSGGLLDAVLNFFGL